ncbi:hypothetical protein [Bacillus sp. JJ722]|uniref:hypothetical protein n=1 Tax=Bacillus sp. JJ722 TaxID=3122973 RepID=UPI002FFF4B47
MKRSFQSAKVITKYLEGRYGKTNKNTDDIQYAKDLANDHSINELNMMKKRIDTSISFKKDTTPKVSFFTLTFGVQHLSYSIKRKIRLSIINNRALLLNNIYSY